MQCIIPNCMCVLLTPHMYFYPFYLDVLFTNTWHLTPIHRHIYVPYYLLETKDVAIYSIQHYPLAPTYTHNIPQGI